MNRLSGDQNGMIACCVPGSGRASEAPSSRTQSCEAPDESVATNAMAPPSGETAVCSSSSSMLAPSGGTTDTRIGRASTWGRRMTYRLSAPVSTSSPAATIHPACVWKRRRAATGTGTLVCDLPSAIHSSWSFTSCAVWIRCSASFRRHARTSRSNAGGASGASCVIGAGSLAWLLPSSCSGAMY